MGPRMRFDLQSILARLRLRRSRLKPGSAISIYLVGARLIVCPQLTTPDGYYTDGTPIARDWPMPADEFTRILHDGLLASGRITPSPRASGIDTFKPVLAAAHKRSFKSFMADARLVDLTLADDRLEIAPMRNRGSRMGFEGDGTAIMRLPATDLGRAATHIIELLDLNAH
jgi:hypothetical protein